MMHRVSCTSANAGREIAARNNNRNFQDPHLLLGDLSGAIVLKATVRLRLLGPRPQSHKSTSSAAHIECPSAFRYSLFIKCAGESPIQSAASRCWAVAACPAQPAARRTRSGQLNNGLGVMPSLFHQLLDVAPIVKLLGGIWHLAVDHLVSGDPALRKLPETGFSFTPIRNW